MGMFCCRVAKVQKDIRDYQKDEKLNKTKDNVQTHDAIEDDLRRQDVAIQDEVQIEVQIQCSNMDDDHMDYSKSLVRLPTELLIKILSYLPIRDRIIIRYVCRRFQNVSEIPLLWKDFVGSYEPHQVCGVSKVLKAYGEHVRQMFFPAHVMPTKILEMVNCCTKVTHLSLPRDTQLSLDHLQEIMLIMTHLQQLNVFANENFIQKGIPHSHTPCKFIKGLLKVTAANIRELTLQITYNSYLTWIVASIQEWGNQGYPLPSIINIISETPSMKFDLFQFWSTSSSKLPSFEIALYDKTFKGVLLNHYPCVPLQKFKFGPTATPPFIRLSNYGIVGLKHDIFHLREYDHYGIVRCAVTPERDMHIEEKHFNYTSHLHSVSHIDISNSNVHSNHLEQLAIVCPDLHQLNLKRNVNCLKDLQGLRAIVRTSRNLEILNLAEIPISWVESNLLLWELLSSLKKLMHLSTDSCMLKSHDPDGANKQDLINMFKGCHNLLSLDIHCSQNRHCRECNSNADFLFSYFPSLTYCKMCNFKHSGIAYAVTNCYRLKYLREWDAQEESLLPLSNNCHLQILHIISRYVNLTDEYVETLSVHGELERVNLHVNSITMRGITTLINNSPNLIFLNVMFRKSLFNEVDHKRPYNYTDKIKTIFPHHKLFLTGIIFIHKF